MKNTTSEEQLVLQKYQEARNFVAKTGPEYVQKLATKEEKKYFEGVIYHSGIPILALISYLCSPISNF